MSFKEIIHDYEEFCKKLDNTKPIHHDCVGEWIDKHGILYRMTFHIYAISKQGCILIYEVIKDINTLSKEFFNRYRTERYRGFQEIYNKIVEELAKPLGSTEGRIE